MIFIEDSYARVDEIRRLLNLFRRGEARRDGVVLPAMSIAPEEYWSPQDARSRIMGALGNETADDPQPLEWSSDDQVFMDCWDRDGLDDGPSSGPRSTFFALDLLEGLQRTAEAGMPVPQVVVHSRGMEDDLLRAALAEFVTARQEIRVPDESPVVRLRRDLRRPNTGGVLRAMFDRSDFERNLDLILFGDFSKAKEVPDSTSAVWDQVLPSSCLASFHCALRDECPEVWTTVVTRHFVDGTTIDGTNVARITRLAKRYLALNDSWGARGYRAYLAIARELANPTR